MQLSRIAAPVLIAGMMTIGLAACSLSPSSDDAPASHAPSSKPSASTTSAPTTSAPAPQSAGAGTAPQWAKPVTNPGELLTTIKGSDFKVDVYQVGTAAATKTGQFVDPDTNKPIIAVGDPVVYVNYVVTNTGTSDIPLGFSLVDVTARYADWKYLQGMDSIVDSDLEKQMNVNDGALGLNAGEAPFVWSPGTSFSFGDNFKYQAGSPITFTASLTPVNASGDLDHDKNEEVKADTTIK